VAVQRGEKLFPNPEPQLELATGDVLVVLGLRERLEQFEGEVCRQVPAREV
jgi:K+/H+ antiporter YhaU regulatory subunit KhtT